MGSLILIPILVCIAVIAVAVIVIRNLPRRKKDYSRTNVTDNHFNHNTFYDMNQNNSLDSNLDESHHNKHVNLQNHHVSGGFNDETHQHSDSTHVHSDLHHNDNSSDFGNSGDSSDSGGGSDGGGSSD